MRHNFLYNIESNVLHVHCLLKFFNLFIDYLWWLDSLNIPNPVFWGIVDSLDRIFIWRRQYLILSSLKGEDFVFEYHVIRNFVHLFGHFLAHILRVQTQQTFQFQHKILLRFLIFGDHKASSIHNLVNVFIQIIEISQKTFHCFDKALCSRLNILDFKNDHKLHFLHFWKHSIVEVGIRDDSSASKRVQKPRTVNDDYFLPSF